MVVIKNIKNGFGNAIKKMKVSPTFKPDVAEIFESFKNSAPPLEDNPELLHCLEFMDSVISALRKENPSIEDLRNIEVSAALIPGHFPKHMESSDAIKLLARDMSMIAGQELESKYGVISLSSTKIAESFLAKSRSDIEKLMEEMIKCNEPNLKRCVKILKEALDCAEKIAKGTPPTKQELRSISDLNDAIGVVTTENNESSRWKTSYPELYKAALNVEGKRELTGFIELSSQLEENLLMTQASTENELAENAPEADQQGLATQPPSDSNDITEPH